MEYMTIVEYAPYQKIPKPTKEDARMNTLESGNSQIHHFYSLNTIRCGLYCISKGIRESKWNARTR